VLTAALSRRCHNRVVASDERLRPGGLAGADVAVESTAPEAGALVALLAAEGARPRLALPAELDRDPHADAAFLDVWTPEVAPRVGGLRAHGALVTCLADLVLHRAGGRTVGITGTAGKTTTTSILAQLLRAAGIDADCAAPGLSGNLWADQALLAAAAEPAAARPLLLELTSSHLAFCHASPHVAVVTSFWADHVELHGSLAGYARAKEAVVRRQEPDDWLVVPADGTCRRFADVSAARVVHFSAGARELERGAFVRRGRVVVRWQGEEHELAAVDDLRLRGCAVGAALAALAAAAAAGAPVDAVGQALPGVTVPRHRFVEVARVGGVPVYDDSMAGTPAKAAAALELFRDGSIVLVAGGETTGAAGPVLATPEERSMLERAAATAARKAKRTVLFGPAAAALAELLPDAELADDIDDAVARALEHAAGADAVLVAPMFPVAPAARDRVAALQSR
jgi:UDP-N-acetylmuramoylalanine--D-glutamate ligase